MNCANHPDRERVAFCQHCGKPLCEECVHSVGNSVFCEPCFAARGAAGTPPPPPGYGYAPGGYAPGPTAGYGAPHPPGRPEPAIAALLGFIPGVGAMYNEQYAKGIVHLIVFAILVSLASNSGGGIGPLFGLFVAGWIFYMVFEAHHTARARRDGTPLPNPFGLNDLGERLGFGRAWPAPEGHVPPPYHPGATQSSVPPYDPAQPSASGQQAAAPGQTYSAPGAYFHQGADGSQTYSTPGSYYHRAADGSQTYGVPPASQWGAPYEAPPVPPAPGMPAYPDANAPQHRSIPTGAIWLIGLGVLFLIGHAPVFRVFHGRLFGPMLLIAVGVWMFVRRMTETGHGLENDGSDYYRWRLGYALHGAVWVILFGVLWLLNSLGVLSWVHSWPIYMIAAGVLMILRRTAFNGYGPGSAYAHPQQPAAPSTAAPVTTTEIVPVDPMQGHGDPTQTNTEADESSHEEER